MGCGFSSAREAKDSDNSKDYDKYSNGRAASAGKDSDSKTALGDVFTATMGVPGGGSDRFPDRSANAGTRHNNFVNGNTVHQPSEATSSQINFFRMLDEKIENGIEFDDLEEETFRREQLLRSVAEWESIVARANGDTNYNNTAARQLARSVSTTPPSPSSPCSTASPSTARPKSDMASAPRSVAMAAWTSAPRTPSAALSRSASADSGAPAISRSIGLAKVLVDTQRTQ